MKYVVTITETLRRRVIVDAVDSDDASRKVHTAYDNGKIELDYRDFNGYEIYTNRIACGGDVERYEEMEV